MALIAKAQTGELQTNAGENTGLNKQATRNMSGQSDDMTVNIPREPGSKTGKGWRRQRGRWAWGCWERQGERWGRGRS